MNQMTKTRFFLLLKRKNANTSSLGKEYDKFAALLFAEGNTATDKTTYHNTLAYTRAELACLTKVSGKKCGNFSGKGYRID
jgi:hypothetical protein